MQLTQVGSLGLSMASCLSLQAHRCYYSAASQQDALSLIGDGRKQRVPVSASPIPLINFDPRLPLGSLYFPREAVWTA